MVRAAGRHHADLVVDLERAVEDAHQRDDADVVVEPGVDDQRLQRRVRIALGLRNAFDELLDQLLDALAGLAGDLERVVGRDADDLLDLLDDARGIGRRQVDLVDDRHDFETELGGGVAVGDALRLDALRRIDHQQRAVAGGQRARHFIGEVHVAGRVDEVQLVGLAVLLRLVIKSDRLGLDGDAALALELERIEDLVLHFAGFEAAADLDEAVGQRGLAVIDVGDDREIAYALHQGEVGLPPILRKSRMLTLSAGKN